MATNAAISASMDITEEKRRQLRALIPDAFTEGKLDVSALKLALGETAVVEAGERYALSWAGKADAYKVLQAPTTATLRPQPDLSVNFEEAQHIFIEGENMEVLKVLQKAYFAKVKLIYIDPPYNTGSDSFIYPDRFQESKEDYLKRINDLSDDGTLMREGFFQKNNKENGRYHSNWLSMMLPRLYIARNLLCDNGIIFVSCDDNEVHNLRCLMNEVFSEENFVTQIIWKKSYGGGSKTKHVVVLHEYVLCFARNKDSLGRLELPPDPEARRYYKLKDKKFETRGPYRLQPLATTSNDETENLRYAIPYQDEEIWPEKQWQWEKNRAMAALGNDELVIAKSKGEWSVNYKQYLYDEDGVERGAKPYSVQEGPYTQTGTAEVKDLLGGSKIFPFPKPTELVRHFIQYAHPDKDFIAMDFFAGAASTAHAVLNQNAADGGTRKFICVQLPELCEAGTDAAAAGFKTIADISRARISKVIGNIKASGDLTQSSANLGFKSFRLTPSNFKQWRGDGIDDEAALAAQIEMFVKAEKDGSGPGNILYELLLKLGQPLSTPVERFEVAGVPVYAIKEKALLFVLEHFTLEMIEPLLALKPREIVALDSVFQDSDKLKSNLDLQCRDANLRFTCI